MRLKNKKIISSQTKIPVFDLTVKNTHNFCVGFDNLVVHNCTNYAHGVGSLEGTIIGLAQDFAGSNNIPIFEKFGQFGDRLNKKAAASRYVKVKLAPYFRQLFRKEDDLIFEFMSSNGMLVEPKYFTPMLPLVLINGAEGMGTGHSTYIMSYNPEEIKSSIVKILDGKKLKPNTLLPWWNGFRGGVSRDKDTGQIEITGTYNIKDGRTPILTVTELPIGIQSDQYKAHLDKLEDREIILSYDNLSDKNGFEFVIRIPKSTAQKSDEEIKKLFKLVSRETENLTVWNGDGVLQRYDNVETLLEDWVAWRTARFEDRRQALIKKTEEDIVWASERYKFIIFYLKNVNFFRDNETKVITDRLTQEGFTRIDDLLSMPMRSLTKQRIEELKKEVEKFQVLLESLKVDTAVAMFKRDLKEVKIA